MGAGEGIEEEDVLDLLSKLVEKSLVVSEAGGGGGVRYRMLEPVRQYARERLAESGEADVIRHRHAAFFLTMAEEAEPGLLGAQQRASWMERVEREHDNFRAALSWALERGEAELSLRLVGALGGFWQIRGYLTEGRRWLEAALASEEEAPPSARLKALIWVGGYAWEQLDYERATASYREALPLARELDDKARIAAALHGLGATEMYLRVELERAWELFEESLALYRELGDTVGIALTLHAMGLVAATRPWQDYERAQALYEESLALARQTESKQLIALSLPPGALIALGRGNYERVRAICEEGLKVARQIEYKHPIIFNLHILAATAGAEGQLVRSARLWGAAAALRQSIGLPGLSPIELREYGPYIDAARARLGEEEWEAAWAEAKAMSEEEAIEYALSKEEPAPPTTSAPQEEQPVTLSRREREVAILVARGLTNRQIAKELVISENTVNRHVAKILRKLGFGSRAQIATWVTERRLLPPDPT